MVTTNYQKLFGDPGRAAETIGSADICWGTLTGEIDCGDPCEPCPLWDAGESRPWKLRCKCGDAERWQEWLESESNPLTEACNAVIGEFPNAIRMLEEA